MAQDNKKKENEVQENQNVDNQEEVNKITEEAQNSLIDNADDKKSKKPKEKKVKDMTSYQEQALQGVTKSKGNKKVLIVVLSLVGLAVVAGVAIALFFVLKPKDEPEKNVVCKVEVLSYTVENTAEPEKYIVFGNGDEFDFNEETQKSTHYTKDFTANISESYDVAYVYVVNNVTSNRYAYTIDFSDMIIQNCDVTVKVNNGQKFTINNERKIVTITEDGDVTLEIRFSVHNTEMEEDELLANTKCEGGIDLTLAIA